MLLPEKMSMLLSCHINIQWHISLLFQIRLIIDWKMQYYSRKTTVWKMPWWICFLQIQVFTSQDINLWTRIVCHCDVFISCLDSHSDGTHSLQGIHWWASDIMLHFSKSVPMKKQTHLHLAWHDGDYNFSKCSFLGELKFVFFSLLKLYWKRKCIFYFKKGILNPKKFLYVNVFYTNISLKCSCRSYKF